MRRDVQRWQRNIGGNIGRSGASPNIFQLPEGAHWLYNGPPVRGDSRGTWLCITKTTSKKVKVDEKKVAVEEAKDDLGVEVDDDDDAWEMEVD